MAAEDITLNDLFNDNGIAGFLQELKADKDLASINIDCLLNVNKVLPVGYPQFIYFFGETFGKLRETGAFKRFFELASKYPDTLLKLANMQLIFPQHPLYGGAKFLVCDHNNRFFHGTTYENYKKIIETGYLKLSDFSDVTDDEEMDNAFIKFFSLEKGHVFLSDDFRVSASYAVKHGTRGIVLCFDLFGYWLEYLHDRTDREFVSSKEISLDQLKEVYLVEVVDNQIQIKEMEAIR